MKFVVFLSFAEDTRRSFTDHLYTHLKKNRISTFRDNYDVNSPKANEELRCSIIVFSKEYVFSSGCLDELVEILKQRRQKGHKVFPVFYDVQPCELRRQTGSVEDAFAEHESRYDQDKTQGWQDALSEAAEIKGWYLEDSFESEFIELIVKEISAELGLTPSSVPGDLIGIHSRLDELHCKIRFKNDDVRVVGICGMGGIGKTTLARVLYTEMSSYFEGKCFLARVREVSMKSGLVSLQKQLISEVFPGEGFQFSSVCEGNDIISHRLPHKKVLLVIDDVNNIQHLDCVAKRDWFGLGSRIIITTRDEHLLRAYKVDDVYKPTKLDDIESLRLFSLKAFDSDTPEIEFMLLSQCVVEYADGLPLALEVLGLHLCGRDAAQWRSAIVRLKRDSKKEIHDCLHPSFDGLEETEKNIFLDIAHFFNGQDRDFVTKILDGCGYQPDVRLDVLIKRSLITIEDNKIRMHKLLQEMGRKIVRENNEPGKRSRLSEESDVYRVLTQNSATEAVEGMVITKITREQKETFILNADAFSKMKKLRLLMVHDPLKSCDLTYLSNELRLFEWPGCPLKSLPWDFQPDNLVALLLPNSCIQQLWNGDRLLNKLKFLDLQGSRKLIRTPDFTRIENLESLNLKGCTNLVHVHPSIAFLPKLKLLNLGTCTSLRSLPTKIRMESLETFILTDCSNLRRLPEFAREMECLLELYLDGTGIKELPSSFGHLNSLKVLNLLGCFKLENLLDFTMIENLESLNLEGCINLVDVHPSISFLPKLKHLNLRNCVSLRSLSINNEMESLETLILSGCKNLKKFPEITGKMEHLLELHLDGTSMEGLPSSVGNLNNLKVLNLLGCFVLENSPPSFLQKICKKGSEVLLSSLNLMLFKKSPNSIALTLPCLSSLSSLRELNISDMNLCKGALFSDICCLSSLETLCLNRNNFTSLPANLSQLTKLRLLDLMGCNKLETLPQLPPSVQGLMVDGCTSLQRVPNPTNPYDPTWVTWFYGVNCFKLAANNNALRMLKGYLKAYANERICVDIVIPGSEIFEWFSHHSEKCSIMIPIWQTDIQWMGFALCCVVGPVSNNVDWTVGSINCIARIHFEDFTFDAPTHTMAFNTQTSKDHLCLWYMPVEHLLDEKFGNLQSRDWIQSCIGIEFLFDPPGIGCKVKKCGARLVYPSDLEDLDLTMEQPSKKRKRYN